MVTTVARPLFMCPSSFSSLLSVWQRQMTVPQKWAADRRTNKLRVEASEMERKKKAKKKHCNQEVFFCFVVGSVLLRNASELIFGQTGPSHLHGFCSTWKETSIKLCFIPEQPCWFLMFALMHLTLIQCCLICLSVFYHVCLSKSVLAKIITWIDSFSIAASFTTDVLKCISDSNTSHHRCSSSLPFPQILSRLISSVLFFLMEF